METSRLRYKQQESQLTLAQGVAEYRLAHPEFGDPASASPEAAAFFQGHDVCHVVFGCGTTPDEEVLADAWTLLGTDVTLSQFLSFLRLAEHADIVREVGLTGACGAVLGAGPRLFRLVWRARGMSRAWPWVHHEEYLDKPLADIRREFGINVLQ